MLELTKEPFFGFSLCMFSYIVAVRINQKAKTAIANPLIIAAAIIIAVLGALRIPLDHFMVGADFVSMFLAPATAALAVSMYRQFEVIKKNWLPIVVGSACGSLTSMASIWVMCRLFKLDEVMTVSLLPKSVTTPIAVSISQNGGGMVPVTMMAVLITGILGSVFSPLLIRIFKVDDPMAAGLSIGACSHALGTSKAVELGETQGAMSGLAIGICGVMTVLFSLFMM